MTKNKHLSQKICTSGLPGSLWEQDSQVGCKPAKNRPRRFFRIVGDAVQVCKKHFLFGGSAYTQKDHWHNNVRENRLAILCNAAANQSCVSHTKPPLANSARESLLRFSATLHPASNALATQRTPCKQCERIAFAILCDAAANQQCVSHTKTPAAYLFCVECVLCHVVLRLRHCPCYISVVVSR